MNGKVFLKLLKRIAPIAVAVIMVMNTTIPQVLADDAQAAAVAVTTATTGQAGNSAGKEASADTGSQGDNAGQGSGTDDQKKEDTSSSASGQEKSGTASSVSSASSASAASASSASSDAATSASSADPAQSRLKMKMMKNVLKQTISIDLTIDGGKGSVTFNDNTSVSEDGECTITPDEDGSVSFSVSPDEGYVLNHVKWNDKEVKASDGSYKISKEDIGQNDGADKLTVNLEKKDVDDVNAPFTIKMDTTYGNGSISFQGADSTTAAASGQTLKYTSDAGDEYDVAFKANESKTEGTVSFTVKADSGYKIDSIFFNDKVLKVKDGSFTDTISLEKDDQGCVKVKNSNSLKVTFRQDFDNSSKHISIKQNGSEVKELDAGQTYQVELSDTFHHNPEVSFEGNSDISFGNVKQGNDSTVTADLTVRDTAKSSDGYQLCVTAKVNGGDQLDYTSDSLPVCGDDQAPVISEGTIGVNGTEYGDEEADPKTSLICSGKAVVTVKAADQGKIQTGIDTVTLKGTMSGQNNQTLTMTADGDGSYSYTFDKAGVYQITAVTAADKSGKTQEQTENTEKIKVIRTIIITSEAGSDEVQYTLTGGTGSDAWTYSDENPWYSKPVHGNADLQLEVTIKKYGRLDEDDVTLTSEDGRQVLKPDKIDDSEKCGWFSLGTSYKVTFTIKAVEQDQTYKVSYRRAGWQKDKVLVPVKVDNTAPSGKVTATIRKADDGSYLAENGTGFDADSYVAGEGKGDVYANGALQVGLSVSKDADEGKFASGVSTFSYAVEDENGIELKKNADHNISDGAVAEDFTLGESSEASYRFNGICIKDRAGNMTYAAGNANTKDDVTYHLDNKKPVIKYAPMEAPVFTEPETADTGVEDEEESEAKEIRYYNHSVSGSVVITDHNLDQSKVNFAAMKEFINPNPTLQGTESDQHTYGYSCSADGEYLFTTEATDLCNNHGGAARSAHIVVDTVAPVIKVTYNAGGTEVTPAGETSSYYNKNVTVNIQVTDKNIDAKGVVAEITGTTAEGAAISETLTGTLSEGTDKVWTASYTTPADGKYKVSVKAADKATNTAEYAGEGFTVDTTVPKISVVYDNNDPQNEKYYKADRTATITVTDYTFDAAKADLALDCTQTPSQSDWVAGDHNTYVKTVKFSEDGHYDFTFACEDKAGNKSDTYEEKDFFIDKTAPVIKVTYDNNAVANGKYYKAARNATISVSDLTFSADLVKMELQKQADLSPLPALSGFSEVSQMNHTAQMNFRTDGNYGYTISCTDLAGNVSETYVSELFTIDTTAPAVTFGGVENYSANNGTVAPTLNYSDKFMDMAKSAVSMKGSNHGEVNLTAQTAQTEDGYKVSYADFPHTKDMDDLYTLQADVFDMAGNETKEKLVFSVNRFGSVYVIGDSTAKLIDAYYTNKPQEVSITEINIDKLTYKDVSISRDGDISELKNGRDYSVTSQGSDQSWKSFTYTLKAVNFEKDGNYSVTVYSEDRATNKQDNRSKDKEIDFAVDQTAPSIVVSGLDNNGVYAEDGHQIALDVTDNMGVTGLQVFSDDTQLASWDADTLQAAGGTENLKIPAKDGYQNIRLVSEDVAGNQTETDYSNVVISLNAKKIIATPPVAKKAGPDNTTPGGGTKKPYGVIAAVAAAVIAAGAGVGLFLGRKKIRIRHQNDKNDTAA